MSGKRLSPGMVWILLILAGGSLSLAHPDWNLSGLAWILPGVIGGLALARPKKTFLAGCVAGFAFQLALLHWLLFIPFPVGAVAGWIALSAYLSVYMGTWTALTSAILNHLQADPAPEFWFQKIVAMPWGRRLLWMASSAAAWVALEMIQGRFLSGFPWNYLGVSQYQNLPLIQVASITGVYGLSFVMVWTSLALSTSVLRLISAPGQRRIWLADFIVPLLMIFGLLAYGMTRPAPPTGKTLHVALIQPSIPQTLIFDSNEDMTRFRSLLRLTEEALEAKPDVVIWPEAGVPGLFRYQTNIAFPIMKMARDHKVWILFGCDDAEGTDDPERPSYFNSSFLVSPEGKMTANYRKRRLVIFGEYVPFIQWIPFIKYFTPVREGFTPGREMIPFEMKPLQAKTGILICFEDTFPHLVPEYVQPDTDFLVNLTNNGWFGESSAQWQHAANAVFRAVENGLPLVRCSNNGLTCWVDARGGMHSVYFPEDKNIYREGYKLVEVPLLPEGTLRAPTFYNRFGDWFGWSCVGGTVVWLGRMWRRKKAKSRASLSS